jgi:cytochrome c biogenesis protein CcmG/thiol:disulfide interchange protein DsbE
VLFSSDDASVSSGGETVALQPANASISTAPMGSKGVGLSEGQVAPDFEFSAFDGKRQKLSDLRGRPVLVNFWATWCIPCRAEMPDLEAALKKYEPQQFAVLGMNNGEKYKAAQSFLDKIGVHFTAFGYDPDGSVAKRYAVQGMPTSYFVDAHGVITRVVTGALTPKLLEGGIDSAIAGAQ